MFLDKELGLKIACFLDLKFNSTIQCIFNENPKLSKLMFRWLITVNCETLIKRTLYHYFQSIETANTMI